MELQMKKNGSFNILQLTDLHVGSTPFNEQDIRTFDHIKEMAGKAAPDLIVISGDLVWSEGVPNPKEGYARIVETLNELEIPVAITYGNHDTEEGISRSELRELENGIHLLAEKKHSCIVEDKESYCLEIKNEDAQVSHVIYIIDSGAEDPLKIGQYEYVHPDHVTWFNEVSKNYASRSAEYKPDVLFLHIPLPEYKEGFMEGQVSGYRYEEISSPLVNTGLFTSLLIDGKVGGVFCGHDHDNDFVADWHGIKLGFGRVSGFNCYGELTRGARIITLHNDRNFDTHIVETEDKK